MIYQFLRLRFMPLLVMCIYCSVASAQNNITVTMNITPPYSPQFSSYAEQPGKVMLLLRNSGRTAATVYLQVNVTGDNKVSLTTIPGTKSTQPITIAAGQVYQADINTLRDLFSTTKYNYAGITPADVFRKNGLPEGNYDVCVRAYDYYTNAPMSGDAPTGCRNIQIANLEPPLLIKPLVDDNIKPFEPQNIIFTWTVPAGAQPGTQYKLRMVEMLDPNRNINDAFRSGTTPDFFETDVAGNAFVYGPAQPTLIKGRKYAWAVTALSSNGVSYRNNGQSEIRAFTFAPVPKSTPTITMLYPADGASMPQIDGIDANKFDFTWDYTNPFNVSFTQDVWMYEVHDGQTPADAVKNNQRANSTSEPDKKAFFSYRGDTADGKTFAWYVSLTSGSDVYKSDIRTFTVQKNANADANITSFTMCGYTVSPVTIYKNEGGYKYSGSGFINLYNDGPQVDISFDNLVIEPFSSKQEIRLKDTTYKFSDWRAVSGTVTKKAYKATMHFTNDGDVGGDSWFDIGSLTFTPAIQSHFVEAKKCFYQDGLFDGNGVQINGLFSWQSEFTYIDKSGVEQDALYTKEITTKFDYTDLFGKAEFYPMFPNGGDMNIIHLSQPNGVVLTLIPKIVIQAGLTPTVVFTFDGNCDIAGPGFHIGGAVADKLEVSFSGQHSMAFTVPIAKHTVVLNRDESVVASFESVAINLSGGGQIGFAKIPSLNIVCTANGKSIPLNFLKSYYQVGKGIGCSDKEDNSQAFELSTFPVSVTYSQIALYGSQLTNLDIEGTLKVPLVNLKGNLQITADQIKMGESTVDFDLNAKSNIYTDPVSGNVCDFEPYWGVFKNDRIVFSGNMDLYNINGDDKGFNTSYMAVPDIFIKSNGDAGMESGNAFTYQAKALYNDFKFIPSTLNLSHTNGSYNFSLGGNLVLADNLASPPKDGGSSPNFTASANFSDNSSTDAQSGKNATTVGLSSSDVSGICPDTNVCKINGSFTYFDDNVHKGFMLSANFGITEPEDMTINAKMIVAKQKATATSNAFYYWYFEGGATLAEPVPIGLLDLGIYQFDGRVYYKMSHTGTDINADDYKPDNGTCIGMYAMAGLASTEDNGIKFWGNLGCEITTTSHSLAQIKFKGNGSVLQLEGRGHDGMMQAKDAELNFDWVNKSINGSLNIEANYFGMINVSGNGGLNIDGNGFDVWAQATSAQLFGYDMMDGSSAGCELTNKQLTIGGDFKMIDFHRDFDFAICDPSVDVKSNIFFLADFVYNPFFFQGSGTLNAGVRVAGCRLHATLGMQLNAQVEFPNPTCVSAGIKIHTKLKNFGFSVGVSNGAIIFHDCYKTN